ncbi:response regulator [Sphingomonas sp. LaA6.9]|uniref:response regulator n=1 Tax=Sphingomonas sp. LaA6.9 TaxID=2919914 RepID=UPI001F5025A4|nr:response regulator [Sphingomonas sp. LaA6.9]MCJ8159314.1 response regulator [Sphingomonas sp. LaA6.9]
MTTPLRILIIEDEPLIAMMLEDFIEALGHVRAGTADSIATALPLVERGSFDAVILDVNLRGGELCWPVADRLAEDGKPYLLASGGQSEALPDAHACAPVLAKPFTMDGVRSALERLAG